MMTAKYTCTNCGAIQDRKYIDAMIEAGFEARHLVCSDCGQDAIIAEDRQHTPGPWGEDSHNVYKDSVNIARLDASNANKEANAKLIAAAPELLEACKSAMAFAEIRHEAKPTHGSQRIITTLATAINKATA